MKKLLFLFVACLALSLTSNAQEKGDISGFFSVSYLANTDGFVGINIGGEYMITDKLSVAPSYTYFLKKIKIMVFNELQVVSNRMLLI
jgi:hypothetical protein